MMKTLYSLMFVFCCVSLAFAQDDSCIDQFRSVAPIQPEINPTTRNSNPIPVMAWYSSQCVLVGSSTGLWLYDLDQPDHPLWLANSGDKAIASVAVNPVDSTIAFSLVDEPLFYLVSIAGTSVIQADNDAITSISFSADGSLIAVASSLVEPDWGFYYDARIQIWGLTDLVEIVNVVSETGAIEQLNFSEDNLYLLSNGGRMGFFGADTEYWDLTTKSKVWDYYDLMGEIDLNANDPMLVWLVAINGQNIAFAGQYGYMDYDDYYGHAIHLWDVERQERRLEIIVAPSDYSIASEDPLRSIVFNSDGSVLASTSSDGIVTLWDVTDGRPITQLQTLMTNVWTLSYSPDDHFVAITSLTAVSIWDVELREEYALLDYHHLPENDQ